MTFVISAVTRIDAWLQATEYLLKEDHNLNVILSIASPGSDRSVSAPVTSRINAFYKSENSPPLHTVAETIFPGWQYRHRGLAGVFETYPAEYEILKSGEPYRWGTYAHRLVARRNRDGDIVNPLDTLIKKMRSESNQAKRGAYRSCYEIGIAESEYDLPLYNTIDDQGRRRGLPCLSHLSFKLYEGSVHLTAIYRSHDYRFRALGNLLGLARLQACVSHETGIPLGTLVVHSTYAYLEAGNGKAALRNLVADVRHFVEIRNKDELAETIC